MVSSQGIATAKELQPKAHEAREGRPAGGTTAAAVLLMAIGIGLAAGFLDLGVFIVRISVLEGEFYYLSQDFVWMVPAAVAGLVLLPGTILALIAQLRRGAMRVDIVVGLLVFFGSLDVAARLSLDLWTAPFLCGGLAVQSARLTRSHTGAFLILVRRTTPVLVGGLLATMVVTVGGRAWSEHRASATLPPPPIPRNVLLIVWDTVRNANTSLHGYYRRTTPHLEELAARGVRCDLAFATSSWTLPSHASLFTGRWPHQLGVDWTTPLRPDVPTLAEYLAARGYDTAGFVANFDYCSRETGLARGFAHYEDYPINLWDTFTRYLALGRRLDLPSLVPALDALIENAFGRSPRLAVHAAEHAKDAIAVNGAFLTWLDGQRGRRRPFFAFLNFNDAHTPYEVPDRSVAGFGLRPSSGRDLKTLAAWNSLPKESLTPRDVRMAIDVYDDSIAALDRRLGELLQELDRRGVLDDTLVIVTADHGEHLGDHGLYFHGCSLYRQLVQVPLVIVGKDVPAGRVVAEPLSLRDIPATIIGLLGLRSDASLPGRSLARFWDQGAELAEARPRSVPLLIQTGKPINLVNQGREPIAIGPMSSVVSMGMHYIRLADRREELYLLDSDPEEQHNVAGSPMAGAALEELRQQLVSLFQEP